MWSLFKKKPPEVIMVERPKPPEIETTTYTKYFNTRNGNYLVRIKRTITRRYHPSWPYSNQDYKDEIVPFDFESDLELVPD